MKAMLLAAGLGKRLRPLTDSIPKPLLEVGGKTLIEHHLVRLADAGVEEVVVNLHHLGDQIQEKLGDGSGFGLSITYSIEPELLETGGGIRKALPLLGEEPFIVVSADTYLDFDLSRLPKVLPTGCRACLVMTSNPRHHPKGDFSLDAKGHLGDGTDRLTYTGTSLMSPDLVRSEDSTAFMLRKVFDESIRAGRLDGLLHDGYWCDVGTLERFDELRRRLSG